MSAETAEIDALIEAYLAGNQPYGAFSRRFMEIYLRDDLLDAEAMVYEPAYDIIYMGSAGEPSAEERAAGVLGESEVRARLTTFRTQLAGRASV